jgi:hypothetical protein
VNILYIDLCLEYANPTRNNIVTLLSKIGNLTLYGPGYQSADVLKRGIEDFYSQDKYDFVVINETLVFCLHDGYKSPSQSFFKIYRNNYYFQFNTNILKGFVDDCISFINSGFNSEKAVFLLETDYYNLTPLQIESLEKFGGYVIGWGQEFLEYHENLQDIEKESFAHLCNDNYLNYIKESKKIISTPHFVLDSEFNFGVLENRKYDINIAGTQYYLRKQVLQLLKKNQIKTHKSISKLVFRALSLAHCHPYGKYLAMKFYNSVFHKLLIESKSVFTDGARLRWPIRKYFEIPAAGAVLLTDKINGFSNLGFIDGTNCFLVDEQSILHRLEFLKENPKIAQAVAIEGQKLIAHRHSLQARSEQIGACFSKIQKGQFIGSCWKQGEFFVR